MSDLSWIRPRLAELCDISLTSTGDVDDYERDLSGIAKWWCPDLDVAQAIRCWENLQNKGPNGDYFCCMDIRRPICEGWELVLRRGSDDKDHDKAFVLISQQESLPRGICLAIAAALGWVKD